MTASDHVMALLAAGIPLSLLCDLADERGPESAAILLDEPAPAIAATEAALVDLADQRRCSAAG